MRPLITILLFLCALLSQGQTTAFSFTDTTSTTDFSRPGGSWLWNEKSGSQIATGVPAPLAAYHRYTWADIEGATAGSYILTGIRAFFWRCVNSKQKAWIGIMTLYPYGAGNGGFNNMNSYGGGSSAYPLYLHTLMQGETTKDWLSTLNGTNDWVPNYNSTNYLARFDSLNQNIMRWIDTGSYKGVLFKNVFGGFDVRGVGSYGEWHHASIADNISTDFPANTFPTIATFKRIIDIQMDAYTNYPGCIIINSLDCMQFNNTKIPVEIAAYALTRKNTWGPMGLRRDQWGDDESYYHNVLENNTNTFTTTWSGSQYTVASGTLVQMNTLSSARHLTSPFLFEAPGYDNGGSTLRNGVYMGWGPKQVQDYHGYLASNGNYGSDVAPAGTGVDSVRKAFRQAGPRLKLNSGYMTTTLTQGGAFTVALDWENVGYSGEYGTWNTVLELRNASNAVVWSNVSGFIVKRFTTGTGGSTDLVTLNSPPAGSSYRLVVRIEDPTGFMDPMRLGTQGREADGSYPLRSGITVNASTAAPLYPRRPNKSVRLRAF